MPRHAPGAWLHLVVAPSTARVACSRPRAWSLCASGACDRAPRCARLCAACEHKADAGPPRCKRSRRRPQAPPPPRRRRSACWSARPWATGWRLATLTGRCVRATRARRLSPPPLLFRAPHAPPAPAAARVEPEQRRVRGDAARPQGALPAPHPPCGRRQSSAASRDALL